MNGRPPGVAPWKGRVSPELTAWCVEIINNSSLYPMGSESVKLTLDGQFAMVRVEHHTWSTRGQHGMGGNPNERIQGKFRGATLYRVTDPEAYGTYLYNQQNNTSISGDTMRHHFGATPTIEKRPPTVTSQAAGLINLAARPVKWTFHTAGSLVKWVGGTLQNVGNKL